MPDFTQLLTPPVKKLIGALGAAGKTRIVGGAVRNLVMKRPPGDIDLATTVAPQQIIEILAGHNIKTVPTGIAHGTITAVIDGKAYEITTLRRDLATDGRHAQIAFTDDWRQDAARRDFTFNALYLDGDGKIYDYFDGAADAQSGRVRFIGDAETRIREDVLRILRFFRFNAWFAPGLFDAHGLAACRACAGVIPRRSKERVARELLKLLAAPDPLAAWRSLQTCGALPYIAAEATDLPRLENLLATERRLAQPGDALTRLAALLPQNETSATPVVANLKLSNSDAEKLRLLAFLPGRLREKNSPRHLRQMIYRYGAAGCRAALLLNSGDAQQLDIIAAWPDPVFPLKGQDIVGLGVAPGAQIGDLLRQCEEWWIGGDFAAGRAACLAQAKTIWEKSLTK